MSMAYDGPTPDGKFYTFLLDRSHQGHDYYGGASGSPIVDPEGKIVSILLGSPEEPTDIIFGLLLKDYIHLLDINLEQKE